MRKRHLGVLAALLAVGVLAAVPTAGRASAPPEPAAFSVATTDPQSFASPGPQPVGQASVLPGWALNGVAPSADGGVLSATAAQTCDPEAVDGLPPLAVDSGPCAAVDDAGLYNNARFQFGTAVSPVYSAEAFRRLVASWDATTSPGTWIEVHARARIEQSWTRWYSLGVWASDASTIQRHSIPGQDDAAGAVDVDTLKLSQPSSTYQLEVTLFTATPGVSPAIRAVSAVTFDPAAGGAAPGSIGAAINLPVPARSQMLPEYRGLGFGGGGEAWCSPTSVSMIMAYWADVLQRPELRHSVPTVAQGVYDYVDRKTGTWPFNVAYAVSQGLTGSVARFDSFAALRPWLDAGVPVAISFSFAPGQLRGAPIVSSPGHISVVRGFTASGDVIMNDSAVAADGMSIVYDRTELVRAWQRGSGGIAYLIYPRGWAIPR